MSGTDDIKKMVQEVNLSVDKKFKIEGPWAFRGLHELRAPIYIFVPGGEKQEIGEVVVHIDKGMKFEVNLKEGYEDFEMATFEVPMRFNVRQN